jgi:nucleotide-binding universal stress UspA family protein
MATFRKILVPVDFSPHSDEALRVARELAKVFDASLTLINVFSPPIYPMPEGAFMVMPNAYADAVAASTKQLDEIAAGVRAAGTAVETKVREGIPFREIVAYARTAGSDLIVMGTHGRSGLKHALLGSVAEKVVRKAPCAVLTVRLSGHTFEHP